MNSNSWFPYNNFSSKSKLRLFCFHYSGGVASIYRTWQGFYPSFIEICPVQLPGRENRFKEPLIRSMTSLTQELKKAITPYVDIPFAIFGHSLGGLIGFELSRQLKEMNIKPSFLIVSACSPPSLIKESKAYLLSDNEFIKELQSYGVMSEKILTNKEVLQILLPRIRADFQIFETYSYQQKTTLENPIIAFCGQHDPIVPVEHLHAWKNETVSSFQIQLFQGDHFYLQGSEQQISTKIQALLKQFGG